MHSIGLAPRDGDIFRSKFRSLFPNTAFIAEVKTKSDLSGWKSPYSRDFLLDVAETYGDWISIHTHKYWGGSFDHIREARRRVDALPRLRRPFVLAKGIHPSDDYIESSLQCGADYVLVVGRIPSRHSCLRSKILVEMSTLEELALIPAGFKAVWNSRNLKAALQAHERGIKTDHASQNPIAFSHARKITGSPLVQASNIKTVTDADKTADAILVGSNLIEFVHSVLES
jgi:indole-3-glycerol phosphate synthase